MPLGKAAPRRMGDTTRHGQRSKTPVYFPSVGFYSFRIRLQAGGPRTRRRLGPAADRQQRCLAGMLPRARVPARSCQSHPVQAYHARQARAWGAGPISRAAAADPNHCQSHTRPTLQWSPTGSAPHRLSTRRPPDEGHLAATRYLLEESGEQGLFATTVRVIPTTACYRSEIPPTSRSPWLPCHTRPPGKCCTMDASTLSTVACPGRNPTIPTPMAHSHSLLRIGSHVTSKTLLCPLHQISPS